MNVSPFEYLYFLIRYPKYKQYLDMGYGIEARYQACQKYWEPHLRCTKEFIQRAVGEERQDNVAILGSGRLLDIDMNFLMTKFKSIHLYDADPRAIHLSRKKFRSSNAVESFLCEVGGISDLARDSYDTIISLNMLSQIDVYKNLLSQKDHIDIFREAAKKRIILITDRYWHCYNTHLSHWDTQDALKIDWSQSISNEKPIHQDSWFWHIIPPGHEEKDAGSIHEVYAVSFER